MATKPSTNGEPLRKHGKLARPKADDRDASEASAPKLETVAVAQLETHPQNPRKFFSEEKLASLAASFKRHGVLSPLLVRQRPGGTYQVLGGERRYRAAKLAKVDYVPVRVVDVDDPKALELLLADNEEREDLLPLEKAAGVQTLILPVDQAGGGLTLKAAAEKLGYSESWAKNIVRLLKLPEPWRDRVNTGELPERFARMLVPYSDCEAVMADIDRRYLSMGRGGVGCAWWGENDVQRSIINATELLTRPMDKREKYRPFGLKIDGRELAYHELPLVSIAFKEADGDGELLGVVELNGKRVATNVAEYDRRQAAHVEKRARAKLARDAKRYGGRSPAKPSTPGEGAAAEKQREADRRKKLNAALDVWFRDWLRVVLAAQINPGDWQAVKLTLHLLPHVGSYWSRESTPGAIADACASAIAGAGGAKTGAPVNAIIGKGATDDALAQFCRWALTAPRTAASGPEFAHIAPRDVAAVAADYDVDLALAWGLMQGRHAPRAHRDRVEAFLNLHTKAQLEALAKELGENIYGCATKPAIVKRLATLAEGGRVMRFPKALAKRAAAAGLGPAKGTDGKPRPRRVGAKMAQATAPSSAARRRSRAAKK